MTGFNLEEEMEEGHFDADGNYVEAKDDEAAADAWLDGVEVYKPSEVPQPASLVSCAGMARGACMPGEHATHSLTHSSNLSSRGDAERGGAAGGRGGGPGGGARTQQAAAARAGRGGHASARVGGARHAAARRVILGCCGLGRAVLFLAVVMRMDKTR